MKKSELRNIIKEEVQKVLKEDMKIGKDGNLIGMPIPPDSNKIKNSISKIKTWCELMVDTYPSKDPRGRGWKILELPIVDISDVVIMHGNDVFELPKSKYLNRSDNMTIRVIPQDNEIDILLWTDLQSLTILDPFLIGNQFGKGIISLKYKNKLIGNDFSRDINYEYGNDDYEI